jgi:hypothetical protein
VWLTQVLGKSTPSRQIRHKEPQAGLRRRGATTLFDP